MLVVLEVELLGREVPVGCVDGREFLVLETCNRELESGIRVRLLLPQWV